MSRRGPGPGGGALAAVRAHTAARAVRTAVGLAALTAAALLAGCRPEETVRLDLAALPPAAAGGAAVAHAATFAPLGAGDTPRLAGAEVAAIEQPPGTRVAWTLPGGPARLSFLPLGTRSPAGGCGSRYQAAFRPAGAGEETVLYEAPIGPLPRFAPAAVEVDLPAAPGRLAFEIVAPARAPAGCSAGPALWGSPSVVVLRRAARRPPAASPNVLVIGVDTLRADRVGPRGGGRPSLTPAIDRLQAESDVWERAYTSFNSTNPSFVSVFTGLAGRRHGVYDLSTPLPAGHVTLAERFAAAGYRTFAVIAARHLAPRYSGLGQGFDEVVTPHQSQLSAELAVDRAIDWLDRRGGDPEPFFAWLHLFDPHTPTVPPEPFASGLGAAQPAGTAPVGAWRPFRAPGRRDFAERRLGGHPDLYDGEVAYLDRQVDRLLGVLAERRLLAETLVVFFADHGESLGEHGLLHSHAGLYEPSVHVPLSVRWPERFRARRPGGVPAGRRFRGLVQTIDLYPTLLAAAGLPVPGGLDGRDLYALGDAGRPAVFVEHANRAGAAVRTRRHKYVRLSGPAAPHQGPALFDLAADPDETVDLAGRGLAVEERLAAALAGWLAAGRAAAPPVELTDEDRERLRALGYLR